MISRKHRFKGHNSVQKVRSRASRGPGFNIHVQKSNRVWRAAVIVSKKVHKSAVMRNRIRRRVYELIRLYDKEHSLGAHDIVIIVHDPSLARSEYDDLQRSFNKCLKRALTQATYKRTRS